MSFPRRAARVFHLIRRYISTLSATAVHKARGVVIVPVVGLENFRSKRRFILFTVRAPPSPRTRVRVPEYDVWPHVPANLMSSTYARSKSNIFYIYIDEDIGTRVICLSIYFVYVARVSHTV